MGGEDIMIMNNNTNKIIRNLAIKNVNADRKKKYLLILTIALSICLITTICLTILNVMKSKTDEISSLNQSVFFDVSEDITQQLQSNKKVKRIGVGEIFDFLQYNGYQVCMTYYDTTMLYINTAIKGNYPNEQDEIIVSERFLKRLNIKKQVGEDISLDLVGQTQSYTICGIYQDMDQTNDIYPIFVSKDFYENWNGEKRLNAYVWLNNPKSLTEDEASQICKEIASIVRNSGWQLSDYYNQIENNISISNLFLYITIIVMILITTALVIYSIFYISIEEKVKEYGQIRTIGATKKQIYYLVMKEGFYIGTKGIGLGYIFGIVVSFLFYRKGWCLETFLITTLFVIAFGVLLVWLSIHKPSKIASSITPIEAMHGKGLFGVKNKKTKIHAITPNYIAHANLLKNRKKTMLSILSMGLCGLCVVLISFFQSSYNPIVATKSWDMRYGTFQLGMDLESIGLESEDITRILNKQYFTPDFIDSIEQIKGIKGIKRWSCCPIEFSSPEHNLKDTSQLIGYTQDDMRLLEKRLISGKLSDSTVVLSDPERFYKLYQWKPKVGDFITFHFTNRNGEMIEKKFMIGALSKTNDGMRGFFFRLPKSQLDIITGRDSTYSLEIMSDKKYKKEIKRELKQLIMNNTDFKLITIDELIKKNESNGNIIFFLGIAFSFFLGIFAVINEMNLIITNIRSRFYEIAVLQSVGMTRKQLQKSLFIEGIYMNGISIIITLLLGIPGGFIINHMLINMGYADKIRIPFLAIAIYIMINICLEVILLIVSIRNIKKVSIVNRLHENY